MATTYHFNHHHRDEVATPPSSLLHRRVSLIKRPPLVRSASPTLQNNNGLRRTASNSSLNKHHKPKKSVRFCDNASLENVRLFLKTQMPKACRSDPACPKKYSYRIRRTNWPSETAHTRRNRVGSAIRVEDIQLLSSDNNSLDKKGITLIGTCQVANLAFEKHVTIRYTFDEWTTVHETEAIYQEPIANSANTWDRFRFKINLNAMHHAHETIYLAAKYNVSGREFWDNNDNKNYQVDILSDVQLQLHDDLSSSSSDEDDDNTFEDCLDGDDDEDDEELIQKLKPLSLTKPSFGSRYNFDTAAVDKPLTPPLSPTTPIDSHPLWATASPIDNNKDSPSTAVDAMNTMSKENNLYFAAKQQLPDTTSISSSSPVSTEFGKLHELIHKYCYYGDHRRPVIYTQYHSDPPRCSSPKPIHS